MHNNDCQLQCHFSSCLLGFVFAFVHFVLPLGSFFFHLFYLYLWASVRVWGAIKKCVKTCEELYKLKHDSAGVKHTEQTG